MVFGSMMSVGVLYWMMVVMYVVGGVYVDMFVW